MKLRRFGHLLPMGEKRHAKNIWEAALKKKEKLLAKGINDPPKVFGTYDKELVPGKEFDRMAGILRYLEEVELVKNIVRR